MAYKQYYTIDLRDVSSHGFWNLLGVLEPLGLTPALHGYQRPVMVFKFHFSHKVLPTSFSFLIMEAIPTLLSGTLVQERQSY